jgi:hypothetical protein
LHIFKKIIQLQLQIQIKMQVVNKNKNKNKNKDNFKDRRIISFLNNGKAIRTNLNVNKTQAILR